MRVITNLPLNVSEIAAEVSRKTGQSAESVAARVHLIDADTLQRWRTPSKVIGDNDKPVMVVHGPWEFSDDFAAKSDFILDECHIYCPRKGVGSVLFQKPWQDFLGEARHRGYRRLVFVTQDEAKVGTSILEHAELRYELTNAERLRDPWFRISLGDWFELVASITRKYQSSVALTEYRRLVGKMKIVHSERIALDPFFFKFYRSHEVAGGGSETGQVDRPLREFEKRRSFLLEADRRRKGQANLEVVSSPQLVSGRQSVSPRRGGVCVLFRRRRAEGCGLVYLGLLKLCGEGGGQR